MPGNRSRSAERAPLWIQETQESLLILFAERSANSHMPDDCTGDARREALRCIVAAGAVLFEHLLAIPLMHSLRGSALALFGRAAGSERRWSAGGLRQQRQSSDPEQS